MWSRLAIIISVIGLVAAESTILGCLSSVDATSSGLVKGEGKTADECATTCLVDNAWFSTFEASSSSCYCSSAIPEGMLRGSEGCSGTGHVVSVIRPSLVASQVLARAETRRRNERSAKPARLGDTELCTNGMTACNSETPGGNYTCVDTSSELSSCGGCRYGVYGITPPTSASDCSAMIGAKRDSVQCVSGSCLAWACQQGYRLLSDGTCAWV